MFKEPNGGPRQRAREELAFLTQTLHGRGIQFEHVSELEADPARVERAIPVIMEVFPLLKSRSARFEVLKLLASNRGHPKELLTLLRTLRPGIRSEASRTRGRPDTLFAWELSSALEECSELAPVFDDIVAIISDRSYGSARQMLASALAKVKSRRSTAIHVLLELLEDPDLTPHVIEALSRAKAVDAMPRLRTYLLSENSLVRSEATKAVRKLEQLAGASDMAHSSSSRAQPAYGRQEESVPNAETTRNFDLDKLRSVLRQLPTFVDGLYLDLDEIERMLQGIENMELDGERVFEITGRWRGNQESITVNVFMDDVDAPDVTFAGRAELIRLIDQVVDKLSCAR